MTRSGNRLRSELSLPITDRGEELPLGVQLSWRLRAPIYVGEWRSGDCLPSLRALAWSAGVNINTVRAVFAGLERDGLLISRHGKGTFVADGVRPAPQLREIASDALRRVREEGLRQRDLALVLATQSVPSRSQERVRFDRRRCAF